MFLFFYILFSLVIDIYPQFSSTRRLPSRLFSSTRRLFGSPSPSPTPTPAHNPSSSTSSLPARSHVYNGSQSLVTAAGGGVVPPPQQRRLAEFATILGDFKLAVTVWEAMRKEGKGGSVSTLLFVIYLLLIFDLCDFFLFYSIGYTSIAASTLAHDPSSRCQRHIKHTPSNTRTPRTRSTPSTNLRRPLGNRHRQPRFY
jgi:hypothetical protein